jgi:DNA polymerase-4
LILLSIAVKQLLLQCYIFAAITGVTEEAWEMEKLHIIHADLDAYFSSVEQRDNPEYRNKPVIVGGDPNARGVVSTASYEARKYGVRSAMPCHMARELCPHAIFLPPDFEKYKRVSRQVHGIFQRYTSIIEPLSIDEAFLEIRNGDAIDIGKKIKQNVLNELKLTVSVGVSYNKFLAKLASDLEKPDGFTVMDSKRAKALLPSLPVRKLWGVGEKTEQSLNAFGIFNIGDLLNFDREFFLKEWGRRGYELLQLAQGIDHSPVQPHQEAKSLGEEITLDEDTTDTAILEDYLKEFSQAIGERLKRFDLKTRTITLKIRYSDFVSITRSITIEQPCDNPKRIFVESCSMLQTRVPLNKPVRLIGIQVSNLKYRYDPQQLSIFDMQIESD